MREGVWVWGMGNQKVLEYIFVNFPVCRLFLFKIPLYLKPPPIQVKYQSKSALKKVFFWENEDTLEIKVVYW